MDIFTSVGCYFASHLAYSLAAFSQFLCIHLSASCSGQFHFIDPGKHGVEQVKTTLCRNIERIWKCSEFAGHFARKQNNAIDFIAFTVTLSTFAKRFCSVCRGNQTKDFHLHQHYCENLKYCMYEMLCSIYIQTHDCSQTFLSDICSSTEHRVWLKQNYFNAVLNFG